MRGIRIAAAALLPVLLAVMAAVTGLAGSASASTVTTTMADVATGSCLYGDSIGNVTAPSCGGWADQNWILKPVGGALNHGEYTIVNAGTNMCLDSNTSGNVYALPCNGGNYQVWTMGPIGGSPSQFRDFQTGLCLDSSNGNVYSQACNGGAYQQWRHATVTFQIKDNLTGGCIGIASGIAGSWTCTTNPDQTWHWGVNSGGYSQLVNGNSDCLGVDGGSLNYGADIVAQPCNGGASQYWQPLFSPDSSTGYYYLENSNSHYVIGVGGGLTTNGATLVQWPQITHPDQYWTGV